MADIHDYTTAGEKVSEEARKESAKINPDDPLNNPKNVRPVSENNDTTHSVDSETGRTNETNAPRDPNLNSNEGDRHNPQPQGNPREPVNEPRVPQAQSGNRPVVNSVVVAASEFESKKKSFFNPDVDKGFWDTLDQKVKEALSGNTADEIGQNMAFAALTFLFDAISNWAVHHRKEAKRVKKEYEEKTKAFDDVLKNTLIEKYGAVVEFMIKNGVDVRTPEGRKKLEKLKKNPEMIDLCAGALSTTLGREVKPDEASKLIGGTSKALEKGGIALDSQAIADVLRTQDAQDNAAYWDKRAKGQKVSAKNIAQYREQINAARRGEREERREGQDRRRESHDRAA